MDFLFYWTCRMPQRGPTAHGTSAGISGGIGVGVSVGTVSAPALVPYQRRDINVGIKRRYQRRHQCRYQ